MFGRIAFSLFALVMLNFVNSGGTLSCYSCASTIVKFYPKYFKHLPLLLTNDCKEKPEDVKIPLYTNCSNDCVTVLITVTGLPIPVVVRGCLEHLKGVTAKYPDKCITEKLEPPMESAKVCYCTTDKCNNIVSKGMALSHVASSLSKKEQHFFRNI